MVSFNCFVANVKLSKLVSPAIVGDLTVGAQFIPTHLVMSLIEMWSFGAWSTVMYFHRDMIDMMVKMKKWQAEKVGDFLPWFVLCQIYKYIAIFSKKTLIMITIMPLDFLMISWWDLGMQMCCKMKMDVYNQVCICYLYAAEFVKCSLL